MGGGGFSLAIVAAVGDIGGVFDGLEGAGTVVEIAIERCFFPKVFGAFADVTTAGCNLLGCSIEVLSCSLFALLTVLCVADEMAVIFLPWTSRIQEGRIYRFEFVRVECRGLGLFAFRSYRRFMRCGKYTDT